MDVLAARMLRTIRRNDLFPRGARVLAAVSGGSDSVALVLLLRELEDAGELVCAGMAHVNHQLRGEAADADERFCIDLAARLALPIEVGAVDVQAIARARRTSREDAARIARYEFLEVARTRTGADAVAVGHTRDDQAETFLMHVMRGAGSRGRRGIHPRRGPFVRPLLDLRRRELQEYLRGRGVAFRRDDTNDDVSLTRNRVRHELMPVLEARFSPGIVDVLARNAEIARADEAYLAERAREAAGACVRASDDAAVHLEAARLAALPEAIAWRVAAAALDRASGGRASGLEHAQALVGMTADSGPARLDLPGVRAERIDGALVLRKGTGRRAAASGNSFSYTLSIPGEVWLREAGCAISAESAFDAEALDSLSHTRAARTDLAIVAAEGLPAALTVRSRRPGDRFRPVGLGGRKKLQDFFVDRKVRRSERDRVPLVVAGDDRIVWVAGHAISEEFRVSDRTQAVVILRLKESA